MFTRLKKGGPTVILLPRTSSERIGNSVPHSTENAMPTSSRLLKRNAASRLSHRLELDLGLEQRPAGVQQRERQHRAATTRNAEEEVADVATG